MPVEGRAESLGEILGMTSLSLALAVSVLAQAPTLPDRGGARFERLAAYLGLTEEQLASWKPLWEQHRTEMEPLRLAGRRLRQGLKAARGRPSPVPTAIAAATAALQQHHDKVVAAQVAFTGRLTALLTPEQRAKLEEYESSCGSAPGYGRASGRHRHLWQGEPCAPVQG